MSTSVQQGTALSFEPVTRVAGGLALRCEVDSARREYFHARCAARHFRGYETILAGRDARDAIFVSSRCCGYHGGQHAIAAAQALEMALGLPPPPLAIAIRNLGLAAELIHAEAAHLLVLAAPDLSEQSVRSAFPDLWRVAERTEPQNAAIHGFGTVGEIMYSLNAFTGRWYQEALRVARVPYAMYSILHGKYPHPQTIVPGGVASMVSTTNVHDYLIRLLSLVDPAKRVGTLFLDLLDFLVAALPDVARVGERPPSLIDSGMFDAHQGYDPSWEGLTDRGNRRWAAPGVIVDGKLVTGDLREVVEGVEETVEHSFYAAWKGDSTPFNKRTDPLPGAVSWDGRYSWSTAARWRGRVLETGPGARLWATALRGTMPDNPLITAQDGGIQLDLPASGLPRVVLEWRPPATWNAIERNRARLYAIVFAALVAANQVLAVLDLQKLGRTETEADFRRPPARGERRGVGLAGDGLLGHWVVLDGPRIENYQVVAPSTFNLGPGGPAEDAIDATPVLTQTPTGVEALIALRSFDPCVNCAAH